MPAYLRTLYTPMCAAPLCRSKATQELRSSFNETVNYYCDRHAAAALQTQQTLEREQ